jgi:hygromycin-B 4-O-kinase
MAGDLPNDRYLVHADLLNNNLFAHEDRISGVIDWGNAHFGDFLYDLAVLAFWAPWYPAMNGIDWQSEGARHYEAIGLDVPQNNERLRAYQLRIGLDHIAYNAFKERWRELERTAARTLEFVD